MHIYMHIFDNSAFKRITIKGAYIKYQIVNNFSFE